MYKKDVNLNNNEEMITFLRNHFRYYTANSWNLETSYANNIKIYNLDVDKTIKDKMYQLLECECPELEYEIQSLFQMFEKDTGYHCGTNGRSSGYIVMYDTEPTTHKIYLRSIDKDEPFEEWSKDELQERVKLVEKFDELCDDIINVIVSFCISHEYTEEQILVPKTIKTFKPIPSTNDCKGT